MELIKLDNGTALLDPQISVQIAAFERQMKHLKAQEEELKKAILDEMESKNILSIKTDEIQITYIAPGYRESFDSKRFKKDKPETYDEYVKVSPIKASVRVKVRE